MLPYSIQIVALSSQDQLFLLFSRFGVVPCPGRENQRLSSLGAFGKCVLKLCSLIVYEDVYVEMMFPFSRIIVW